jgi:hypothetical protein
LTKLFIVYLRSKRFVMLASAFTGLYVFAWGTKWTFDPYTVGSFWPGRFFTAQADAILQARLWVNPADIPGECWYQDGQCYGYFGLFPSLLRIPFVFILGPTVPELTALFISIAAGITLWAALDLCRRVVDQACPKFSTVPSVFMLVTALALGPAGVLILLSDPYVYQEAIVWSLAGTLVGINLMWRWWSERVQWQLIGSMFAFVCAASARPTAVGIALIISLGLFWLSRVGQRLDRKTLLLALTLSVLPVFVAGGSLFLKFSQLTTPFESYEGLSTSYWPEILEANDGVATGARFVPTGLLVFLRPDSLHISSQWPWIRYRFGGGLEQITFLPPLQKGSMYQEQTTSISNAMPLAFLSTITITSILVRRRRRNFELVLLGALCTPIVVTALNIGVSARYLGDAYPLVAVGMALSGSLIPQFQGLNKRYRNRITGAIVVISLFSLLAMPMLTTQYSWIYRFGIR